MRLIIRGAALAVALWIALFLPQKVEACSCVGSPKPSACSEVTRHEAVFTGTVNRIVETPDALLARIRLDGIAIGLESAAREIEIPVPDTASCGFPFQQGKSYIIYAHKDPNGSLSVSLCSPTHELTGSRQDAEDIAYLRTRMITPSTGTEPGELRIETAIYGQPGTANAIIRAEDGLGRGGPYFTRTNADGSAVIHDLPPGEYRVTAERDGYNSEKYQIVVPSIACGLAAFTMRPAYNIGGRLTRPDGSPAAGIEIQIQLWVSGGWEDFGGKQTDDNGRYEFRGFEKGSYRMGLNISSAPTSDHPFPHWYYPGMTDPNAAVVFRFGDAPETRQADFTLPAPLAARDIAGVIVGPDGSPAAAAIVNILDSALSTSPLSGQVRSGTDGRFRFRVFAEIGYQVYALGVGRSTEGVLTYTSARPADIQPGSEPLELRLVLDQAGNRWDEKMAKEMQERERRFAEHTKEP